MTDVSGVSGCEANDVSVAAINSVQVISGGPVGSDSCFEGGTFSFVANFTIKTTSNKTRSNIGLFFGTNGKSALTGTCTDAILSPTYTCPGTSGATAITCGDPTYEELDNKINGETGPATPGGTAGCGDTSSTDDGGQGFQFANLEIQNVKCNPTPCPASSGLTGDCVSLPECTSWSQPDHGLPFCESPGPNTSPNNPYPWEPAAIPGTSSKCTCTTLLVPVQPIQPAVGVAKACSIGAGSTPPTTTTTPCDAGPEGTTVVYTVTITNQTPGGEGGVIVDQICDNQYGNIFTAGSFTGTACAAGQLCTGANHVAGGKCISSTTCPPSPNDITTTPGSCTFTVIQGENATVNDMVSVSGHSDVAVTPPPTFGPTNSNGVTVTSEDAPTTATTALAYPQNPLQNACVAVIYNVTVANTSAADESVTLNSSAGPPFVSALTDGFFGDITSDHGPSTLSGSVLGTTCGQSGPGLGTLMNTSGAGAFPQTLAAGSGTPPTNNGGTYNCQFVGAICGTPAAIGAPFNCTGLQITDNTGVTANLTGDDPAPHADTISQKSSPFKTTICLSAQ